MQIKPDRLQEEAQPQQQQQHVNQQEQWQQLLLQREADISHTQGKLLVDTLRVETGMKAGHDPFLRWKYIQQGIW